jgi:hypothetical protein
MFERDFSSLSCNKFCNLISKILLEIEMNTKQLSFILIGGGVLIFLLAFIGEIIKFVFRHQILGVALVAILIGVVLMIYTLYQDNKKSEKAQN